MERELQDQSFTELIGLKAQHYNESDYALIAGRIDRELRARYVEFRQYLDNYDQLNPEQKEVAKDCIRYRMALGAVNRVVQRPETQLEADSHRTAIASRIAETAFNQVAKQSHDAILRNTLEEYVD
jgi:hypothetical protein